MPKNLGAKGDYFAKKHSKNIRKKKWRKSHHKDYITTAEAYRKLQLSPAVFRRFMVIKGIHPVLPKKRTLAKKAYYSKKDIQWVIHDKMMKDYRDRITYTKKGKKLQGRHDWHKLDKHNATPPARDFDHVVKERYPTFADALSDVDDALTLIASIARIHARLSFSSGIINDCARLIKEFEAYVAKTGCLTKAFVSVKGIYYQADIMAQRITWLAPFDFHMKLPTNQVDVSLLTNYTEFYRTFIGFVNYKLYTSAGYEYPPNIDDNGNDPGIGAVHMRLKIHSLYDPSRETDKKRAQLTRSEKAVERSINSKFVRVKEEADAPEASDSVIVVEDDDDDIPQELKEEKDEEAKPASDKLFNGLVFWANRECMRGPLDLVIRSFGGRISWFGCDEMVESDPSITHHIVDRKAVDIVPGREYIQPQWVFDSINNKILLPIHEYAPGKALPPHLSPFVNDDHKGYMPDQRVHLDELIEQKLNTMAAKAFEGEEKQEEEEEEEEDEAEAVENRFEMELAAELEGKSYDDIADIGKPEPEPVLNPSDSDYDSEEEKKKAQPPKKVKKPKKLTKEQIEDAEAHELAKHAMDGQAAGKYKFLKGKELNRARRNKLITNRKEAQEAQDKEDRKKARVLRKKNEEKAQKSQERMARKRAAAAEASEEKTEEPSEASAPVEEAPKRKSAGSSKGKPAKKQKSIKH